MATEHPASDLPPEALPRDTRRPPPEARDPNAQEVPAPPEVPNSPPPDLPDTILARDPAVASAERSPLPACWPGLLPGYQILEELGRGGMGVVYKARDLGLDRLVALKMILAGSHASAEERRRFLKEAQVVARLKDARIVPIYEIGEHEGRPFFALEFVDGGSLEARLGGTPQPAGAAAAFVEQLARAVEVAHQQGIVHRDLKPANVLLASRFDVPIDQWQPKITDFGLAKQLGATATDTRSGAILGTPSYMAPEQAVGQNRQIGPAADIYALGAILYELLTGRPPFRAADMLETLRQVLNSEPVPPCRLQPRTPRDLETICLKCLQKDPSKRYARSADLADDLRRFLQGESIRARRAHLGERTVKWVKRRPAVAALTAFSLLAAIVLLVGGVIYNARLQTTNAALEKALGEVRTERDNAAAAQRNEETAHRTLRLALTDMYTSFGLMADQRNNPNQAMLWFANAARLAGEDREREVLNLARVRSWDRRIPYVPVNALPHDCDLFRQVAFHPGGRYFLTVSTADRCTIWDLQTEKPLPLPAGIEAVRSAVWGPDGNSLVLGMVTGEVGIFRFPNGEPLHRIRHLGAIEALAFSRNGRYLAFASTTAQVWDCFKEELATVRLAHPARVEGLAFNAGGDRLATACTDLRARVFVVPGDKAQAEPLFEPVPHKGHWHWHDARMGRPFPPAFADNDQILLCLNNQQEVACRDAATGKQLRTLMPRMDVSSLAVNPDGRHIALGGFARAEFWDPVQGGRIGQPMPHQNAVVALRFRPDGRTLATGSVDRTARLWSFPAGIPLTPPQKHEDYVHVLAYSADGGQLATGQVSGLVRIWAPGSGRPADRRLLLPGSGSLVRFNRDGRYLAASGLTFRAGALRQTEVHSLEKGQATGPPLQLPGVIQDVAFSPDSRQLAVVNSSAQTHQERQEGKNLVLLTGEVSFWDWPSGKRLFPPLPLPTEPRSLDYSPDGKLVAVLGATGQVHVIDPATGRVLLQLGGGSALKFPGDWINNGRLRFSPDGQGLLAWGIDRCLRVWEPGTGKPRYTLTLDALCHDVAFSPDGSVLAVTVRDNTVRFLDFQTGKDVAEPLKLPVWSFSAEFSPDGKHLLTASGDRMARLWDWRKGELVCPPFQHDNEVTEARFTPDGSWVLTVSVDRTARVWEALTGKAVTPPLSLAGPGYGIAVSADGKYAAAGGIEHALDVFDLRALSLEDPLGARDACLWSEILSGQRIHEGGDVSNLTAKEWLDRWQDFRSRHPWHGRPGPAGVP